jgi:hypothetical protein
MDDADTLQLAKAGLLAAAGLAFVWWQLRDVDRERRKSAEERRRRTEESASESGSAADSEPPHRPPAH